MPVSRHTETMYLTASILEIACIVCYVLHCAECLQSCQHLTCHDCIRDPAQCVWCYDDNLQPDKRCQSAGLPTSCTAGVENATSEVTVIDNLNFSDVDPVVQLKPQRVHIQLRAGVPVPFEFSFKAAENYPVDLYFLLDASNSMKPVRDAVLEKSQDINYAMKNLTKNIHFGLGTFIEKNRIPFVQKANDENNHINCYSFKHILNLNNELNEFNEELRNLTFGGNLDVPESGLEGLAQVMSCGEKIGWRSTSRKIIIYLTDANYHSAGDGKLTGLADPFDAECYLNEDGIYTKEHGVDYSSVSVIDKLAAAEQYTTIFFTAENPIYDEPMANIYDILARKLSRAVAVKFTNDNICEKLQDLYKNITTNLLLYTKIPLEYKEYFEIQFNPDCTGVTDCEVHIGEEIHVKGTIKLNKYYGKEHAEILIEQQALKERLILDIDIISSCGCEDGSRTFPNSSVCNEAGSKQCGICVCNKGRTGPLCACSDDGIAATTPAGNKSCIQHGVECNNNGRCICGRCKCNPGLGGYNCQYRSDNCKIDPITKMLCSGHGQCEDGLCHCDQDWRGDACDCPLSPSFCKDDDGVECNGRGHCECGKCKCEKLPEWDVRKYGDSCEREPCEDCHKKQCLKLIPCASCAGKNCPEVCDRVTFLNTTEDVGNWSACLNIRVAIGCYSNYSYIYDNENHAMLLAVPSETNCIESVYIYGGIALLVLLAVGVATLIGWKVMTEARDRQEFQEFIAKAKSEDETILNQCYTPPSTTYHNPMFNKLSFRKNSFR